jgi:hypothetical protein
MVSSIARGTDGLEHAILADGKGATMAEVFATIYQAEALVVKSLLESTGIEAMLSSEHSIDIYPIFSSQEGGIKIVVAEEDAEDARAVVMQFRKSGTGSAPKSPKQDR